MPISAPLGRAPTILALIPLVGSLALAGGKPARQSQTARVKIGAPTGAISFRDVSGQQYTLAALPDRNAVLFLFLSTQCPISNGYTSRLLELQKEYSGRGVAIFGVNSNRNESLAAVTRQAKERGYRFPMVKDVGGALAKRLGASVTPEAVLLDRSGVLRYRGRIDDQRDPRQVKSRDLRSALEAVLSGQPVAQAETKPFGCAIRATARVVSANPKVTFTRDVAPILQQYCQGCHRPGEIGPFSLLTYEDASAWAELIKDYTGRHAMPPWKPADGYGEFRDERKLTDAQIRTLAEWSDEGAPRGNPKEMPPPRQFTEGWQLGKPDMVLDAGTSYEVAADGPDVYRNFVLDYVPDKDQWVKAVEVRPDQRAVVHHVIVYIDPLGRSLELDAKDPGPGYTSSGGGVGFFPAEFLGGWAPGNTPRFVAPGFGMKIPARAHLVLQVHYHKNGKLLHDRTRIGVHFATEPVQKQVRALPVLNTRLSIPPGEGWHEASASFRVPTDLTAYSVIPHMHLLGREMKVTATLPDGSAKPLVWIKDWDFNWQETYLFKEPVKLPKGSRIDLVAHYDNSTKNPYNPNSPPKQVTWGEETTDEMCVAFLGITVDGEQLAAGGGSEKVAQAERR
jgi:peroxiredoxin/mono/diheme cytochrome c family protein